jgi:hypothetical protein
MIKLILTMVMFLSSVSYAAGVTAATTVPAANDVGVGVMIGKPSGVTGKYWLTDVTALDVNLGQDLDYHYNVSADLLIHPNLSAVAKPYIGLGAELFVTDLHQYGTQSDFGLRAPLGIEILPKGYSVGFYGEVAPGFILTNDVHFFLQSTIGARFYFL